ncbi:MAG: hypothetical protein OHK0022_28060 [Roseiflexaceae bacterium]
MGEYNPYKPIRQPPRPATAGRRMPQTAPHPPRTPPDEELFEEEVPPPPAPQLAQTVEEARRRFCERYLLDLLRPLLGDGVALPETIDDWYDLAERLMPLKRQPALAAPQVATWLAEVLRPPVADKK